MDTIVVATMRASPYTQARMLKSISLYKGEALVSAIRYNNADIKKILLFQQRQIGDVVTATPMVTMLHEAFPHAELHFMTEKKCAPILENNPYIHTIWALDKGALKGVWKTWQWYRTIANENFDLVIDCQQLPRTRLLTFLTGAPIRLTMARRWYNTWAYTCMYPQKDGYAAISKASILEALGIAWNGQRPRMFLRTSERHEAQALFRELGITAEHRLITLDPTHKHKNRAWAAKHYARFVDMVYEADNSVRFLAFWGPGEEHVVQELVSMCQHQEAIRIIPRLLSLRVVAACIEAASMHVGNCSAPRHMAVALDTPSFAILGAGRRSWTYPSPEHLAVSAGLACQPCRGTDCPQGDFRCVKDFAPEIVYEAFVKHFALHQK